MPVYPYECRECGKTEDHFRTMAERDNAPLHCGTAMARQICIPMVTPDIQPYRAVAADKETGKRPMINSRKQHNEFLKRNNYEPTA